jgi:hypothetical protein
VYFVSPNGLIRSRFDCYGVFSYLSDFLNWFMLKNKLIRTQNIAMSKIICLGISGLDEHD